MKRRATDCLDVFNRNIELQNKKENLDIHGGLAMAQRLCVICETKFHCMSHSIQMTDSRDCEDLWQKLRPELSVLTDESITQAVGGLASKLKQETNAKENGTKKNQKTPPIVPEELNKNVIATPATEPNSKQSGVNNGETTPLKEKKNSMTNVGNEKTETLNKGEDTGGNTMQETEANLTENHNSQSENTTQLLDSEKQLTTSKLVESLSMSLIDKSAQQVYECMKAAIPENSEFKKFPVDPATIMAVAKGGDTIRELLRLKLDVMKEEGVITIQNAE